MIVCGSPGSVLAMSAPQLEVVLAGRSASTTLSTSRKAATDVADGGGEHHQRGAEQEPLPDAGPRDVVERRGSRDLQVGLAGRCLGIRLTNSTSARRYWSSDSIDTHSSGPWWPSPIGPNSTPGCRR